MSNKASILTQTLTDIGDAVRAKEDSENLIPVMELDNRILNLNKVSLMANKELTAINGADYENMEHIAIPTTISIKDIIIKDNITKVTRKDNGNWIKSIIFPSTLEEFSGSFTDNCLTYTYLDGGYYLGNEENPYLVLAKITP